MTMQNNNGPVYVNQEELSKYNMEINLKRKCKHFRTQCHFPYHVDRWLSHIPYRTLSVIVLLSRDNNIFFLFLKH